MRQQSLCLRTLFSRSLALKGWREDDDPFNPIFKNGVSLRPVNLTRVCGRYAEENFTFY